MSRTEYHNQRSEAHEKKKICDSNTVLYAIVAGLLGSLATSALPIGILPARAQSTTIFDLDQAICANNWSTAISITGQLIAKDETTSEQRSSLLTLRRQLERYRTEGVLVSDVEACDRTDPYLLASNLPTTVQTGNSLGWERAVVEATDNQYRTSEFAEFATESVPFALPVEMGNPLGLTPAEPVDLSRGLNVVSGHVGTGHEVYGFVARRGDRLSANLEVTRVMTGSLYTSDDSQLFIFDREGTLIGSADDNTSTQQSSIENLVVPNTDLYFAVVTTYNNDPILNREGRLSGWQDNGGGRFDYVLTLSGITPTTSLAR